MTEPKAPSYRLVAQARPVLSRSIPRAAAITPTRDFTQDFQDDDLQGFPQTCDASEACISDYQGSTIGVPPLEPTWARAIYGEMIPGPAPDLSLNLVLTPADTRTYHITGLTVGLAFALESNVALNQLTQSDWTDNFGFQILDEAGTVLFDSGGCILTWQLVTDPNGVIRGEVQSCYSYPLLDVQGAKGLKLTREFTLTSVDVLLQYEAIIQWVTVQTTCETVPVVQQCQNNSIWASDTYGLSGDPTKQINDLGCALTSLSMALNASHVAFQGGMTSVTPGVLNILAKDGGWYSVSDVMFDVFTQLITVPGSGWRFVNMWDSTSLQSLVGPICSGHPVIVGVKFKYNKKGQAYPGHYVLVIGIDPNDSTTFLIADPNCNPRNPNPTLKDYGNQFVARGYVDQQGPLGPLEVAGPAGPAIQMSTLDMGITNSFTLVTSPTGQRTGNDPATGTDFNEIPQSGHYTDGFVDDVTGIWLPDTSSTITIFQPGAGTYRVQLTTLLPEPSKISLFAFSTDGTVQPHHSFSVASPPGHMVSFNVQYSPVPGSSLVFEPNTPTAITYSGAASCDYHDSAALVASLADTSAAPPVPVPDATLTFTIGNQTCQAQTDATGHATCALTLNQKPGAYTVSVHFAGNEVYLPSNAGPTDFAVTREETTVEIVSSSTLPVGSVNVRGILTEDVAAVPNPGGQTVDFTATPAIGGLPVTTSPTIDSAGVAQANMPLPPGAYELTLNFRGDGYYQPGSASQTLYVYQPTQFVIWGGNPPIPSGQRANLVVGDSYEFWGADWSKQVLGGSYTGGASFKGYADQVDWVNGQWTTGPGGSSKPPATVASYIGVIAATDIVRDGGSGAGNGPHPAPHPGDEQGAGPHGRSGGGAVIQGNIAEVVVIDVTDPAAYRPDPGHRGTGVFVAVVH